MIRFIKKYKKSITMTLFAAGFTFALLGINAVDKEASLVSIFFKMLPATVFFDYPDSSNIYIVLSKFLFLLAMVFGFVVVFFSNVFNRCSVWLIQLKPYNLVIGYGVQNQALLSRGWGCGKTIIVEPNIDDLGIDHIQNKHYAIKQHFAKNAIAELDLKNLEKCIISIGSDNKNIAVAIELLAKLDNNHQRRIFVHIENRDLAVLFKQNVIKGHGQNDIVPYSVHEMLIRDLFAKYSLLGLQTKIINSDDTYASIVIGEGELAAEIVCYLANIAHLPNQNSLSVYCVSKTADKFIDNLNKKFSGIRRIPHLKLKAVCLDNNGLDFYTHAIWRSNKLSNIFIATSDENTNLDIAVNLQDTTYIKQIASNKRFDTRVLFAMYQNSQLAQNINDNKKLFANFYSFANLNQVICKENLFAEKLDTLAKLINFNYDKINQKNHTK